MSETSDVILERMMALHPKVIDLTLDRVWTLLAKMDDPQTKLPPVIHIAGTNGKGSTLAMLRAGIEEAGKTTHAYTSPHLAWFHERIRLRGALISEADLTDVLDRCYRANGTDPITYFEITTIAALVAFAEAEADYTLLEVGLGGRLDATNVIDTPALTVITPVDLDHQQFLGETLAEIAGEKAGILKRGVTCVVGPQKEDALDVIERQAARVGATLLTYGQHWHVSTENDRLVFQDETGLLDLPLPSLRGPHQILNAGAAIAGLRHLGFDEAACEAAVTQATWPARMERLTQGPLVDMVAPGDLWLDGGHNPAAGLAIAKTLKELPKRPTHLICGMLNTKAYQGFLEPIAPLAASLTAIDIPDEPNSLPAQAIADAAEAVGVNAITAPSLEQALSHIAQTDPGARIVICGSLYLAGHVKRLNEPKVSMP